MTTTESVEYDRLGRIVRQTDVLGRVTATAYSENGLTETVTTPSGATLVTERHPDGSVLHEYGTGQRERYHVYDIGDNCLRETVTLADQTTLLSRTLVNGFGQSVLQVTPTTAGFLYDHSEYNAQGRLGAARTGQQPHPGICLQRGKRGGRRLSGHDANTL